MCHLRKSIRYGKRFSMLKSQGRVYTTISYRFEGDRWNESETYFGGEKIHKTYFMTAINSSGECLPPLRHHIELSTIVSTVDVEKIAD
ncbi:hypothetical protein TcasGA2_TC005705 [Tribolium castaneum]|uniref:Uncharacterized protein n=1 Tax=Tribolium castaneum TaxID=7070 RepID=D6WWP8_TRICA|nr:hypothetical protein TcasGA2_TC005705 [Tribolium castaneum]